MINFSLNWWDYIALFSIINFIKITEIVENPFFILLLRIIIIFPLYQLVLTLIATIFGEFKYFLTFTKGTYKKIFKKLK